MKPRITHKGGLWWCQSRHPQAKTYLGSSPSAAYRAWLADQPIRTQVQAKIRDALDYDPMRG